MLDVIVQPHLGQVEERECFEVKGTGMIGSYSVPLRQVVEGPERLEVGVMKTRSLLSGLA